MNYTLSEIKQTLPKEKNLNDPLLIRFFYRPLSYPFTWLLIRTPLSANAVSYLSALVCIFCGALIISGNYGYAIIGAATFNLFGILDCVDGNISRLKPKLHSYGDWADALAGYIAYATLLPAAGLAVSLYQSGDWNSVIWLSLGFIAAISTLLTRLSHQKLENLMKNKKLNSSEKTSLFININKNLGITGFLIPIVLVGLVFNFLHYIIVFYAIYYLLTMVLFIIRQIFIVESSSMNK